MGALKGAARRLTRPLRRFRRAVRDRAEFSDGSVGSRVGIALSHLRRLPRLHSRVLFYPDLPYAGYKISQICKMLGYRRVNDPDGPFDLVFKWRDATHYAPDDLLLSLKARYGAVNADCNDIGKRRVSAVMEEVFGYRSDVDPRAQHGPLIRKSNLNSQEDQTIVDGPIDEPDPEAVYQRLLRGAEDGSVRELRVSICCGEVLCVVERTRPFEEIFNPAVSTARLPRPLDAFSAAELEKLGAFSEEMGLDFGDLDVIRDFPTGLVHVIDVNNTPSQLGPAYPQALRERVLDICARAFERSYGP